MTTKNANLRTALRRKYAAGWLTQAEYHRLLLPLYDKNDQ